MKLNQLKDNQGARKAGTRVGRGSSSGLGKTCGRGVKGAKARAGVSIHGFEGGQMPLYMRIPKRGFYNHFANDFASINLDRVQAAIDAGKFQGKDTITVDAIKDDEDKPRRLDFKGSVTNHQQQAEVAAATAEAAAK